MLKGLLKKVQSFINKFNILHDSFEVGILLKGLNGLLETAGGLFLIFLTPARMHRIAQFLIDQGLSEDPHDFIASHILLFLRNFSIHTRNFAVFYLFSHGLVKVFMVYFLWKRKLWAYPFAIIVLLCFIAIQVYMFIYKPSTWVAALTVFDTVLIFLTLHEYNSIKQEFNKEGGGGKAKTAGSK